METSSNWKQFWEQKAKVSVPDHEVDRLSGFQDQEIDRLAEEELVRFIAPEPTESLLDAGCGTGTNVLRLHSRVRTIFGIDFCSGSIERCNRRIAESGVRNVTVQEASVTAVPLAAHSVDKIICMSVLHYLSDDEVRQTLSEFVRVVKPQGVIIFHVKNLGSAYWATLQPLKKLKRLWKKNRPTEYVRSFQWYADVLRSFGCSIVDYDSLNLLVLDFMPGKMVSAVRGFEVKHHRQKLFRSSFVRRHGAELMIKARVSG